MAHYQCNQHSRPGYDKSGATVICEPTTDYTNVDFTGTNSSSPTTPDFTNEKATAFQAWGSPVPPDVPVRQDPPTWQPSIIRLSALSGLCALLFSVLQIFAAYGILSASHGVAVDRWRLSPTVFLATLTAISNKALAFAAVQATVITFWVRALHGTTLGQLHRDWAYGLHVLRAITAGRNFNLLALGCICATLVAVDGPLLQKASTVVLQVPNDETQLSIWISQELPAYSTGPTIYTDNKIPMFDWLREFLPFVKEYNSDDTLHYGISGCEVGTCTATIRAPAFAVDECTSYPRYRNFTEPLTSEEQALLRNGAALSESRIIYEVNAWSVNGSTEYLVLQTAIPDDQIVSTCAGHMLYTQCFYASAIADYDVQIINNTIAPLEHEAALHPKIISRANNTALTDETIRKFDLLFDKEAYTPGSTPVVRTTLGGILASLLQQFYGQRILIPGNAGQQPTLALQPFAFKSTARWFALEHMTNYAAWDNSDPGVCAPAYRDYHPDIVAEMNRIMFRAGFWFANNYNHSYLASMSDPGLELTYNTTGVSRSPVPVFSSNFSYFAGAAAIQIITIAVLLLNFYGFWRLGRPVSFSPLEIAKAFDASLLQQIGPIYHGPEIAAVENGRRIQYGAVSHIESPDFTVEKLMMDDEKNVHRPSPTWDIV